MIAEDDAAKIAAAAPEPKSVRESDTLGRAGRVSKKGNPIETARARTMTPEDGLRVEIAGVDSPLWAVTTPANVALPADDVDDHRGLQHLDGNSEPRPPRSFEDARAAERALVGQSEREALARSLRRKRSEMPIQERIMWLKHRALVMQSQKARRIAENDADARQSAVEGDRIPNGDGHCAIGFADAAEVERRWRHIELQVEALEAYWDAHDGIQTKSYAMMTSAEKDALLTGRTFRGMHCRDIHALHPELGAERTIRHARAKAGQDVYGADKPKTDDRQGVAA